MNKILILFTLILVPLFSQDLALKSYLDKNYVEAFKLYLEEAKQGNVKAQSALSYLYFQGLGTTKDEAKALEYLRKSANGGDANAAYDLGMFYLLGVHVQENHKKAFKWLTKASKQNHADAQYNLAIMYYNGDTTKVNLKKTARLLESAAMQGHKKSQKIVGVVYMQNLKFEKAKKWLKRSAKEGDLKAIKLLKEIDKLQKDQENH